MGTTINTIYSGSDVVVGDYPALYGLPARQAPSSVPARPASWMRWSDAFRVIAVTALVASTLTAIAMTHLGGKRGPTSLHEATVRVATCENSPFELAAAVSETLVGDVCCKSGNGSLARPDRL